MSLICKLSFEELEKKAKGFIGKWLFILIFLYAIFLIFEFILINLHTLELIHILHKIYGIF